MIRSHLNFEDQINRNDLLRVFASGLVAALQKSVATDHGLVSPLQQAIATPSFPVVL